MREFERFLGIPIGSKLLFNVTTDIHAQLNQLSESGLTPWQKIEDLRSHLIPSLSHELSSGRVMKESIYDLDKSIKLILLTMLLLHYSMLSDILTAWGLVKSAKK